MLLRRRWIDFISIYVMERVVSQLVCSLAVPLAKKPPIRAISRLSTDTPTAIRDQTSQRQDGTPLDCQ